MEAQEIKETKKPKGLLLHFDKWDLLEPFDDADIGAIIKALFRYALEGVSADVSSFNNRFAFAVYKNLRSCYESNQDKYEQRCRKNQENAKKAAEGRKLKEQLLMQQVADYQHKLANASDREQTPANTNTKTKTDTKTKTKPITDTRTKSNPNTITNPTVHQETGFDDNSVNSAISATCVNSAEVQSAIGSASVPQVDSSDPREEDEGMNEENEDDLEDIPEYTDSDDPDCTQSDGLKEGKENSVCCEIEDLSFERIYEAYGRPECNMDQVRGIWDNLPGEERRKALAFIPRYFDVRTPQYRRKFFNYLSYQTWNEPLKDYGNRITRTDHIENGSSDDRNTAEARKAIESLLGSCSGTTAK